MMIVRVSLKFDNVTKYNLLILKSMNKILVTQR